MKFDIAIIGDGILGISIAYRLSKEKDLKIALIGSNVLNNSASLAAGAMLNCFGEVTKDSFKDKFTEAKFNLGYQASKLWNEWVEDINSNLDQKLDIEKETFVILNSKSGQLDSDNFSAIASSLEKYNQPWEYVNPTDIPGLEPCEGSRPLNALVIKNEGYIESSRFMNSIKYILSIRKNITLIDKNVIDINSDENAINNIMLDNKDIIHADKFILAAGSYSQNIIDKIPAIKNKIPRILSGTGYAVITNQPYENKIKSVIRTPNRSGACGLHVLPNYDNLYIGATNNVCFEPTTTPKAGLVQFVINCAIEQVNHKLYGADLIELKYGNRPVSLDTFPLIGKTSLENLWITSSTYRDGFYQSPYISKVLCDEMLGKNPNPMKIFLPERNLIQTMSSIEESAEEVSHHYLAGLVEHNMNLPKLFPEEDLRQLFVQKFLNVYKKLDINFPLAPDILFMFELDANKDNNIQYFKKLLKGLCSHS